MSLYSLSAEEIKKQSAWSGAFVVNGYDPGAFRRDRFGWIIKYDEYGKCSAYGWEIDHVVPQSWGGLAASHNEVATHWRVNRWKGDRFAG